MTETLSTTLDKRDNSPMTTEEYDAHYGDELRALGIYEDNVPEIGPSPADVRVYSDMLKELREGVKRQPGVRNAAYFSPRTTAEDMSLRLEKSELGVGAARGGVINDPATAYNVAQQRYAARLLGFRVGPVRVGRNPSGSFSGIASMEATFPDKATLPPLPVPDPHGVYRDAQGRELNQIQIDTHYAAHYLAENKERYSQPEALYKLFKRVTKEADDESNHHTIRVPSDQANDPGRLSLIRQTARILGYTFDGAILKDKSSGDVFLKISGVRPGFDSKHSNMRREIARERRGTLAQQALAKSA